MSVAQPVQATEDLLDRLSKAENGEYFTLVKLKGAGVPADLELYFCKNKFAVVQVRVKTLVSGVVHEFGVGARDIKPAGGVYELKCKSCNHELQVKVQPALGLLNLLKPPPYLNAEEVDGILRRLEALAGLYHVLLAFQQDPTCEEVPLAAAAPGATRNLGRLAEDVEVLELFVDKCPIFSRLGMASELGAPARPRLRLADCARPRTRGMILKALLEVKMLLVIAVEHFQNDETQFTGKQLQDFHNFLIEIHEDCLAGGAAEQYQPVMESWESLKSLVCGPSVDAAEVEQRDNTSQKLTVKEAWKVLQECAANLKNSVLPNLQQRGQPTSDLVLPSTDFTSAAGGAVFKAEYCKIWRRAIDTYLFDLVHSSRYAKGPTQGLAMIRNQWSRPDRALQLTCPSPDLDKAIAKCSEELEPFLTEKAAKRRDGVSVNFNPKNSTGLTNPGENLCAANALVQFLFSVEPLREAVLQAPDTATTAQSANVAPKLEDEAQLLVSGLRRLFADMSRPERGLTSARDVAAALYGKELGQQQDCDELMHRLSLLLQDGLSGIDGKPFEALGCCFRRHLVGATCEARLNAEDSGEFQPRCAGPSEAKPFLSIPVQEGNTSVMQALEEFTSWSATGGSEVAWTQERLSTLPPFLCFSSRQVVDVSWEESLDLTRCVSPSSSSVQRSMFERSRAQQLQTELREALQHLRPASRSLTKANSLGCRSLTPQVEQLARVLAEVEVRLEPVSGQIAELDATIGDGSAEPTLAAFLEGTPEASAVLSGLSSIGGVATLEALALGADGADGAEDGTEEWRGLLQRGVVPQAAAADVLARLRRRRLARLVYDVHAIVVYQGLGQFGHYVAFIRHADGSFLCFDDEQVTELRSAEEVRGEIARRGGQGYPATVRMVAYRRRASEEPVEVDHGGVANGGSAKRPCVVGDGARAEKRPRVA